MQTAIVGGDVSAMKAREAFLAYRNLVREGRATEDDELLMRSYRAIAQGKRVLDLRETLRQAGLDEQMRPKLAIGRADLSRVMFSRSWRLNRWVYSDTQGRYGPRNVSSGLAVPVQINTYPQLPHADAVRPAVGRPWSSITAIVPTIPPQFRPAHYLLRNFHILWEAVWEPAPPHDPILLKRIGGHLYAVLAQWDLTELERAVLGARLS